MSSGQARAAMVAARDRGHAGRGPAIDRECGPHAARANSDGGILSPPAHTASLKCPLWRWKNQ